MENDKILMAAGVTVAAVVGAFVFWGPSGSSRLRQRRGQIAGLHNFGQTCFLNTLLQAFAACPQFIAWLQLYNNASSDRKSLITSLLNTLEVVNGTHSTLRGDPHSPGTVIRALNSLGWVIPQEEHDAHELFHVLLSSLEEEAHRPKQVGSLMDALASVDTVGDQPNRPASAMLSTDFLNSEYDEDASFTRMARSEVHTPDSPSSVVERNLLTENLPTNPSPSHLENQPMNILNTSLLTEKNHSCRSRNSGDRRASSCFHSLERLSRGPGKVSIWSEQMPNLVPQPFQGALGTQIVCNGCGYKSTVRYDKFDSVTLNLPTQRRAGLSLGHLLSDYITSEEVHDVKCESCNESTTHTKSLTFAKLPACLCIHIARTVWLPTGQVCKRQDYVHFPESLSMAPYCFIQPHLNSQAGTPWGSTMSLFSSSLPTNSMGGANDLYSSRSGFGVMFPRNLYRLLAVIVHSGEANSGHFVTYRRGSLRNAHRWYYTSDTVVREVCIDEVLSTPAYLIFYDRSSQRSMR